MIQTETSKQATGKHLKVAGDNMLIIGSYALSLYNKDIYNESTFRKSRDVDVFCLYNEYDNWIKKHKQDLVKFYPISKNKNVVYHKNGTIFEFEIAWEDSSAESLLNHPKLTKYTFKDHDNIVDPDCLIATDSLCYMLKMSHRFLRNSPFFEKTRNDIMLLRYLGATMPPEFSEWYKQREKETYDYSHPNLKQSKNNFFDTPGVTYRYDHDTIHEAVKLYDTPAYSHFKDDEAEVYCSRAKFEGCDEKIKLASVLEESYVLALERCLVPFDFKTTPKDAFVMALQKVCTSITSGWWRDYAWEHYGNALAFYSDDYVDKFKYGLQQNIVKEVK